MRIMRTKIPDSREIYDSVASIAYVYDAVSYRVDDLISMLSLLCSLAWYADLMYIGIFSHQRMDLEKQFQGFVFGIVSSSFLFWIVIV
jgi:hypothetical protein